MLEHGHDDKFLKTTQPSKFYYSYKEACIVCFGSLEVFSLLLVGRHHYGFGVGVTTLN